jgi:hypothetical protein
MATISQKLPADYFGGIANVTVLHLMIPDEWLAFDIWEFAPLGYLWISLDIVGFRWI